MADSDPRTFTHGLYCIFKKLQNVILFHYSSIIQHCLEFTPLFLYIISIQYFSVHVCHKIIPITFSKFFNVLLNAFIHALCIARHFIAECACILPWNQIPGVWFHTVLNLDLQSFPSEMIAHDSQVALKSLTTSNERVTIPRLHYHCVAS